MTVGAQATDGRPASPGAIAEFRRHGGIAAAAMLGIGLGLAPMPVTYTLGVFTPALIAAFGWTRAEILFVTVPMLLGILPASFAAGWLADRHGVRRLVMGSQLLFGACFVVLGLFVRSLAQFYLVFFAMGVLGAGTLPITFARAITSAFDRARGLALGVALAGTGVCGFVLPLVATHLLERFGWRQAYVALGLMPVLIALPVCAWLLREQPPRGGDAGPDRAPAEASPGRSLAEALADWRFWLLGVVFFVVSGAVTGILPNLVPLLRDQGYDAVRAAELASLVGITVIGGRLAVGLLVDRFWAPAVGFVFLAPASLAVLQLAGLGLDTGSTLVTGIAIAMLGLAVGAEVDLNAYLASRYFGRRHYGQIYALQYLFLSVGSALAAPLFGWARDDSGSYAGVLATAGAAFLAGACALLALGRFPRFEESGQT